jgi:hypothetical protein
LHLLFAKRFATFSTFFLATPKPRISIPVEVDVKIAKTGAVTVRLDPELKGRLAQAAAKLDLSENVWLGGFEARHIDRMSVRLQPV